MKGQIKTDIFLLKPPIVQNLITQSINCKIKQLRKELEKKKKESSSLNHCKKWPYKRHVLIYSLERFYRTFLRWWALKWPCNEKRLMNNRFISLRVFYELKSEKRYIYTVNLLNTQFLGILFEKRYSSDLKVLPLAFLSKEGKK